MKWTESSWFRCEGCLLTSFGAVIILGIFLPCVIFIPLANRSWETCNVTVISCKTDIYEDDERVVMYYSFDVELNTSQCNHTVNETIRVGADSSMNCTLYGEKWNEPSDCYYRIENDCDITITRPPFLLGSWETSDAVYIVSIVMCIIVLLGIVSYILLYSFRGCLEDRARRQYDILIEYDL